MPPNILLFLTDDHGQWALGSSGNDRIQAPNLDYLADTGTVMENAFTPTPVCSPARACLLTGRTASQHGIHDYLDNLPAHFRRDWLDEKLTLPELLQNAGYRTGHVGKWHLGNDDKSARGFDSWGALAGDYPIDATGPARYCADGELKTIAGSKASIITDGAVRFLKNCDNDRPFFLLVGHVSTHSPWEGHPKRLVARYSMLDFAEVPQHETYPFGEQNLESRLLIDRANPRAGLAQYYASVTSIDEGVGRLMDTLDAEGLGEETVIIYTSDHGLNCGHHGIWGKGNGTLPLNMVDESIRIPMIVNGPGISKGQVRRDFVDHLDLFSTIVDLAGLRHPCDIDYAGKSFRHILAGDDAENWRQMQFCEYGNVQMVRDSRYKLVIWHDTGQLRLFDLHDDPREERDLAKMPEHANRCKDMLSRLQNYYDRFSLPDTSGVRPGGPETTNVTSPWSREAS